MRWFIIAYLILGIGTAGFVSAANQKSGLIPPDEMGDEFVWSILLWPAVVGVVVFGEALLSRDACGEDAE
jgi:hypothetical protein